MDEYLSSASRLDANELAIQKPRVHSHRETEMEQWCHQDQWAQYYLFTNTNLGCTSHLLCLVASMDFQKENKNTPKI